MADDYIQKASGGSGTDSDEDLLQVDLANLDEFLLEPCHVRLRVLRRTNYRLWAQSHERFLRGRGIWGIVSGTLPRPTTSIKEARNWVILDRWIAVLLAGHVEDCQQCYISDLKRSKDIWDALRRVHDMSGRRRLESLTERFYYYRKSKDESIDQMVSNLKQLSDEICDLDPEQKPIDIHQALVIMSACEGKHYDMAKEYLCEEDELTTALAVEHLRSVEADMHQSKGGANVAKGNRGKSGGQRKS